MINYDNIYLPNETLPNKSLKIKIFIWQFIKAYKILNTSNFVMDTLIKSLIKVVQIYLQMYIV